MIGTSIYVRVQRDGIWQPVDVVDLTEEELRQWAGGMNLATARAWTRGLVVWARGAIDIIGRCHSCRARYVDAVNRCTGKTCDAGHPMSPEVEIHRLRAELRTIGEWCRDEAARELADDPTDETAGAMRDVAARALAALDRTGP